MWYIILVGFLMVATFAAFMLFMKTRQLAEQLFFEERAREYDLDAYERAQKELLIKLLGAYIHLYHARRERDDAHRNLVMVIEHKDPVPIGIPTKKGRKKR